MNTFPGKVKSIDLPAAAPASQRWCDGGKGVYLATAEPEDDVVASCALKVLLLELSNGKCIQPVRCRNVPATASFIYCVAEPTSYLCRYLWTQESLRREILVSAALRRLNPFHQF